MAITFESLKDPYGIQQASSILGQALMQRTAQDQQQERQIGLEKRAEEQQIAAEQRRLQQQRLGSQTLGQTLQEMQPKENEQWDQTRVNSFISNALSKGSSVSDIMNTLKAMGIGQKQQASSASTPFAKKMGAANADILKNAVDSGRKAKDMLSTWDELDAAISDPERADNWIARGLKMAPTASAFYGPSDQIISSFAKEIITNFTNMKNIRLTDAKLKWLESIAPAPWKSIEANKAASAYFKRLAQIQDAYGDIYSNLSNSYLEAGLDLPTNFDKLVDDAMEPFRQEIDNVYKNREKGISVSSKSTEIGSTFDKLPDPKGYEGAELTDDKGNKFISTGTTWRKVK